MFSAFAAFLDEGDEVIVMEPYFDQVPRNVLCSSTHYFE
jgi:kynurenine aminotransferase